MKGSKESRILFRIYIASVVTAVLSFIGLLTVATLLILALSSIGHADPYNAEERFSGEYSTDYALHYGVGAVIGAGTMLLIPDKWELSYWQKWFMSIGVAMAVKATIEVFDDNPSAWDVMEYGAGSAIGAGAVYIVTISF